MEITTRDLQKLYDLRQKEERVTAEISALRTRQKDLREECLALEKHYLGLLDSGAKVKSLKFITAIKDHLIQTYINWQKEYQANHPKEYAAIKAERGKIQERELVVALKTDAELDALLGVSRD